MQRTAQRVGRRIVRVVAARELVIEDLVSTPQANHAVHRLLPQAIGPGLLHDLQRASEDILRQTPSGGELPGYVAPADHPSVEQPLGLYSVLPTGA
eukprot:12430736-Karenia_brevis.AAC.1